MSKIFKQFTKEDIRMTSRHVKRYSVLLVIRERGIKTTTDYSMAGMEAALTTPSAASMLSRGLI
jgi:hypothetical protein